MCAYLIQLIVTQCTQAWLDASCGQADQDQSKQETWSVFKHGQGCMSCTANVYQIAVGLVGIMSAWGQICINAESAARRCELSALIHKQYCVQWADLLVTLSFGLWNRRFVFRDWHCTQGADYHWCWILIIENSRRLTIWGSNCKGLTMLC